MHLQILYESETDMEPMEFTGHAKIMRNGNLRLLTTEREQKLLNETMRGMFIGAIGLVLDEVDSSVNSSSLRLKMAKEEFEGVDFASFPDGLSFGLVSIMLPSDKPKKKKSPRPQRLKSSRSDAKWSWSGPSK